MKKEANVEYNNLYISNDFHFLPRDCIFTMQQWLYRRTLHTKRYKKRYVVLHNERLYTFTKLPSFDKFDPQNISSVLKSASNSWILTGSLVSADPDVNSGLYRWKIEFKGYKKPVSSTENFNKFLLDKPELDVQNVDHIDSIFDEVTSTVLENRTSTMESHDCLWFATTNHKIASDWVIALLFTSRFGSLYNLIYKNPSRRRYQQFTLPWYLIPLDYLPNLSNDENSKQPLTSFTYIKINVHRVFDFPMLPNAKVYCAVEFNSSFYILQLYRHELENSTSTPTAVLNDDDRMSSLSYYVNRNAEQSLGNANDVGVPLTQGGRSSNADESESHFENLSGVGSIRSIDDPVSETQRLTSTLGGSSCSVANSVAPAEDESQNVITRLLNLNSTKNIEKKQVVEKRSIIYKDASIYIPVYKNTTQEVVWLHFFGDYDVYMGTASIRDVDFGSRDPAPVKTCMIKLIDSLNPLNYKRADVSTYKVESTVLNKSTAKSISNDRGFVELSVIIPKHLGNFLDPVTISYGSPKEYLSNATKSSISAGIQMLIANIKRVRQSFTVIKDIVYALKSVLEFRNALSSFMAMSYFILVFGIFPNRMLIIFLLPLLGYIVCTHPSFADLTFLFLLKFPILIAVLPKSFIYPFLLMPKTSCILCSKKPSFLKKNAQTVDPEMVSRSEISSRTFQYSSNRKMLHKSLYADHYKKANMDPSEVITNPFSAANAIQVNSGTGKDTMNNYDETGKSTPRDYVDFEKRISVHQNSLPMITSKHLLNDSIEITRYRGTKIETCKHRGIIMSYLSILFINEMGVELFDSVKGDGLSIIKGYHDIYYNTPPYRHVPFWANVKFTLYFFLYMLFLTFFGGISNLQLLHLLHRNKLMCRLTLESTGIVQHKSKTHEAQSKGKNSSLYENERRILFGKFSKMNLRFYERGYFSTEDGQFVSVDLSKYLIRLVVNENTDSEGWRYARNWNSPFSKEATPMTFVRRRKWVLTPKDAKKSEYILKRRFSSNLSREHFGEGQSAKPQRDEDCVSLSSTDSVPPSKQVLKSNGTNGNQQAGHPANSADGSSATSATNLGKPGDLDDGHFTVSNAPDDQVAKLYARGRRVRFLVDKLRNMRESRRNQKQHGSNMSMYLSSLLSSKSSDPSAPKPPRKLDLRSFRFSKKDPLAASVSAGSADGSVDAGFSRPLDASSAHSSSSYPSNADLTRLSSSASNSLENQSDLLRSLRNLNKDVPTRTDTSPPVTRLSKKQPAESQKVRYRPLSSNYSSLRTADLSSHMLENGRSLGSTRFNFRRGYKHNDNRLTKSSSIPSLNTKSVVPSSKIARLISYITSLHSSDDQISTDRSAFSTISQQSTLSQGARNKGKTWKFFETIFAIIFAFPVCLVLDVWKLIVGFFRILFRKLLGIPEPEEPVEPVLTPQPLTKHRYFCRLVSSSDNTVFFKLTKPRRCFIVGERLKAFRNVCRAENMSLVDNMNRLMLDTGRKYDSDSEFTNDLESVSSVTTLADSPIERSFSNEYVEDSDVLLESDLDTANRNEMITEDNLDELRTLSMNPFDLDDSDEDLLNMMRRSYDSAEPEKIPKKGKKKGKFANYLSGIYYKRMTRKGKYIDEQHLSDYEQDSDENTKSDNKIGVIAMLKKVKDQIVMANYKINLYNMRFEKLLNMFSWKNYSVTTIVLFLLLLVILLNLMFSIEIIMLAYILIQFKNGYKRGTWERIILNTTKRHISKAIVELEIFRPFWDLSTHQIGVLSNRIKAFSSIELEINTIREAKDEWHLAHIVSDRLVSNKFSRNWKRYRWINNLLRQAPCQQY